MSYAADVLSRERAQLAVRLDALIEETRALKQRLRELDAAIETLTGVMPSVTVSASYSPDDASAVRLIDRIQRMLPKEGHGTTPKEIAAALTENGRATSNETVASLLSRLRKTGKAEKRGRAWFGAGSLPIATVVQQAEPDPHRNEEAAGSTTPSGSSSEGDNLFRDPAPAG